MTVRLPDGTVARGSGKSPTPLYDATLNSDPGRYLWLVGLGSYPGPLPKPPQEDTPDPAPGTEPATPSPAVPPAGDAEGQLALPGAEQDVQEAPPLEPLPEPVCGLVSHDGTSCGLEPGHDPATHGPAERGPGTDAA
jgi:hypothetical protein